MSDTSAVDQGDDADTKTTPDQPGQPNTQQTWRPPPGLPTPLRALASQLASAQGSPAGPLPQPAPLPPFDQAQQRVQQREQQFARPTGAFPPYRESPVQTYVPARPIREPHQWGASDPYPNTPATWELPGMWQGIGQKLSQTGSGVVAGLAGLLSMFSADSMKNYIAGQTARMKLDHERRVDAAWEIDRRLDEEIRDARDSFAILGGDVTSWTGLSAKDVDKFMDSQREIAARNNDHYLQAAIDSGDFKRVENLWKERDATSRDLKASLTQQRKDETRRENQQPYLEDGGPSQAGPPLGDVNPDPVPEAGPPKDATPSEAQPGDPVPSGATPPLEEPAAPDATAPDFDPASAAPQAKAEPRRPVRLAQAGASDAPLPGVGQVAPQPSNDTMGWQPSQSVLNGATNEDGAKFKPGALEPFAQEATRNPLFKPSAKQQYPGLPDVRASEWVTRRQQQIDGDLLRIEQDPRFDPQPNDSDAVRQRKRAAAYRAINSVAPKFATDLYHYVQGDMAVPTAQRYVDYRNHVIALGKKIDPTFDQNTYLNRVTIKKQVTTGVEGRTMVGIVTADSHSKRLIGLAEQLRQAQIQGGWGGPLANRAYQRWASNMPPNLGGDQHILDIVSQFKTEAALVAPEIARAQKGAAPTQGEINEHLSLLDPGLPVETLIHNINNGRDLFHDRMRKIVTKFETLSGGKPDTAMLNWFHTFEMSGFKFDKPDNPGGVQGDPPPMEGSGSVTGAIYDFIHNQPGGGPITQPRGGAPAIVQTPADVRGLPSGTPFIIPSGPHKGETGYAP